MIKLQKTYDAEGNERLYREGEDGKEYLYYKGKKFIIRDFFPEDAKKFYFSMLSNELKYNSKQRKIGIAAMEKKISSKTEDDFSCGFIITTTAGKMVGAMEVKTFEHESCYPLEVLIAVKETEMYRAEEVIDAVIDMHHKYLWGDKLYCRDEESGELVEMEE